MRVSGRTGCIDLLHRYSLEGLLNREQVLMLVSCASLDKTQVTEIKSVARSTPSIPALDGKHVKRKKKKKAKQHDQFAGYAS